MDDVLERSIADEVAEVIAETLDELGLMTMGYPDNRFFVDDDLDGEDAPVVQLLDRWRDRYTPFHKEYFQHVSSR